MLILQLAFPTYSWQPEELQFLLQPEKKEEQEEFM
jgi:hypothetical protein